MAEIESHVSNFLLNAEESYENPYYEKWNTTTFINTTAIHNYFKRTDPVSPHCKKTAELLMGYLKYCHDNDSFFPWGSLQCAEGSDQLGREKFTEFYNSLEI